MSHITKTFTQEEKDTLSQVVIKVEKVKNGFEDYITTTEVKHWWRTRSVITNVRKEDFHRDSLRMLWVWEWDGLQHIIGTNYSPEEEIEHLRAVTREDVIKAASSLTLDTVYVLTKKGDE